MFKPDTYKLTYLKDEVKKTFAQYKLQSAEKTLLPDVIRLEKNNGFNSITGADNLLRIRNAPNWKKCNLTGLRPTEIPKFYYADLLIKSVKSLLVIHYDNATDILQIRVAPQFYPHVKPELYKLVNELINNF